MARDDKFWLSNHCLGDHQELIVSLEKLTKGIQSYEVSNLSRKPCRVSLGLVQLVPSHLDTLMTFMALLKIKNSNFHDLQLCCITMYAVINM